ncbi:MAG: tRNA uridine-5-carboxymethylaminomethyl(34) synthesis enzyme MnmG [Bacteroidetes bacterium]|nr:tRNA uridine-5-carboxymethylaminomethyl(34) synthesis enzyme MnmG [Bacteroidota bacterium]
MFKKYDIIVVGAGHAGSEAAAAAANLGSTVLLITMSMENMAQMSCNPAMGGIAKGQIVREIDALGGYSGIVTDKSMIQFRMLNKSKGPAMWSPRAQSDRMLFSKEWRAILESLRNVDFWQDTVIEIVQKNNQISGVKTLMGHFVEASAVVLTNGTFLNGTIHIGTKSFGGGRIGERASIGLTDNLKSFGFQSDRMKTGTPVRVDGRTIDFSKMQEQKGDEIPGKFSYTKTPFLNKQRSCYLAYTSEEVHNTLRTGFHQSPMFTGRIMGVGPRYCPSIEDKIERFSDKDQHQLFIEPEGWTTVEYYVNGFSSSLPANIQLKALRKIVGFEEAKIFRPGYAIEYDYFPPVQLNYTLETKLIKNLFFAGQINGTTGYEEAASQGIIAGINAHQLAKGKEEFTLKRSDSYIGVLIDDLITKGVDEPYRMFTSRAEYRLLLRQDNADIRLTNRSYNIGLASQERNDAVQRKAQIMDKIIHELRNVSLDPDEINAYLEKKNTSRITQKTKIANLVLRPQVNLPELISVSKKAKEIIEKIGVVQDELVESIEILIKYEGYISKELELVRKFEKYENLILKTDLDYQSLQSLSFEAREKLNKIKPKTIGQAARISGVSPSDISVLTVYLGK